MLQHWRVGCDDQSPEENEGDDGVTASAYRQRTQWVDYSQIAVERHEYQRVDTGVRRHVNHVLVDLTTRTQDTQRSDVHLKTLSESLQLILIHCTVDTDTFKQHEFIDTCTA